MQGSKHLLKASQRTMSSQNGNLTVEKLDLSPMHSLYWAAHEGNTQSRNTLSYVEKKQSGGRNSQESMCLIPP